MNDPISRRGTAPARTPSTQVPLARALALAEALRGLLDEELRAATTAESAAIEALVARKRHLLDSLEALQPALGRALETDGTVDGTIDQTRAALLNCLAECRAHNLENGIAVRTVSGHVRSALSMLRETLALDDLTLYDERGELYVRRERRRFGQA